MALKQTTPGQVQANALRFPDYNDNLVLTGGTAKSFTAPMGATLALLSCTSGFWASATDTAAVPLADEDGGEGPCYIPAAALYLVSGGQEISVVCAVDAELSISFWKHS